MTTVPKISVFIAGANDSGKTCYTMGMFATLAGGLVSGASLHSRDRKLGLGLLNAWTDFAETGLFPDLTAPGMTFTYPFTFKVGLEPWIDFDIMDYRGEVFTLEDDSDPDVKQMLGHLNHSASVYIIIDSGQLLNSVTPANKDSILRATKLRELAGPLHQAIERHQEARLPMPSVALLLTKSDRLRKRFNSDQPDSAALKELIGDLEQLIPLAFSPGITTLVCPVRIGLVDGSQPGQWSADRVDPRNLHRPIAFTLLHYLRIQSLQAKEQIKTLSSSRAQVNREYLEIDNLLFKGSKRKQRMSQLKEQISEIDAAISAAKDDNEVTGTRIDELVPMLRTVTVLQDGLPVNLDQDNASPEGY